MLVGPERVFHAVDNLVDSLDLARARIGLIGARAVADALRTDRSLKSVDLSANQPGPSAMQEILDALADHPELTTLDVSDNALDGLSLEPLASLKRLKRLDVSKNPGLDIHTIANLDLEAACVARCALSDASPLLRMLEGRLMGLDASGNPLEEPDVARLVDALQGVSWFAIDCATETLRRRINGILCATVNADGLPESARWLSRRTLQVSDAPAAVDDPPEVFSDERRGFDDADLLGALKVLEAVVIQPDVLAAHPNLRRLMVTALRRTRRPRRVRRRNPDHEVRAQTGIRRQSDDHGAVEVPAEPLRLKKGRPCYVCKARYTELHHFYDSLCPDCAAFNWDKRRQTADLAGRTALVTGSRIKVGYEIVLRLLRAGARVIGTTRFPRDAARRFAGEPDYDRWVDRLELHPLNLLFVDRIQEFAQQLSTREARLDILINCAAQTVARPSGFYAQLSELEKRPLDELPADLSRLLAVGSPQNPLLPVPHEDLRLFPAGTDDGFGQPLDLRSKNSWKLRLHEVGTTELVMVQVVNAIAPFVLVSKLRSLMATTPGDKHIVNVSAVEGQFARDSKTSYHPHTNMAKAALNMMTRTSAADLAKEHVYMVSVDPGWFSNENPFPVAEGMKDAGFSLPLDEQDGAARVLDPIFSGSTEHGVFLKDYRPAPW